MIEFTGADGVEIKIGLLAYCSNNHQLILWDAKPKGSKTRIPCPLCAPKKPEAK